MDVSREVALQKDLKRPVDNTPSNLGVLASPIGPVVLMASPRFFDDHQRFGQSPFDVLCSGGRVTVKEHGQVDSEDLRALMRHAHTMVPFEAFGSYFYSWQSGLAKGFPEFDGTMHVSQDEKYLAFTMRYRGVFFDSTLDKIFKDEYRDKGLIVHYENERLACRASVSLKVDRAEMKRWGDSIRSFERDVAEVAGLVNAVLQANKDEGPKGETRRAVLQEVIYGLLASDPEDRAAAVACLRHAPPAIAEKAAAAYLKLGDEHPLDRRGYYDLSKRESGMPHGVHWDYLHHIVIPLRLEGIKIVGAGGMVRHADRLITLLGHCSYPDHKEYKDYSDQFKKQRDAAAEALGVFARTDSGVLQKLLNIAAPDYAAPWWLKAGAVTALGFSGSEDSKVRAAVLQAAAADKAYCAKVVQTPNGEDENFIRGRLTGAALVAAARLKIPDAQGLIARWLPNRPHGTKPPYDPPVETGAAIEAVTILGGAEAIAQLHKVAENRFNHHNERVAALSGLVKLAPSAHETLVALFAGYFQFKDPAHAHDIIKSMADPMNEKEFTPWWNALVKRIGSDLRYGDLDSLCVRASSAELLAGVPNLGLLRMLSDLDRESGRPEWKVCLRALDHLLKLNPKDAHAIQRVKELWGSIDSYSWHSTSYILSEELAAFAGLFKKLEDSHPGLARGAIKPKAMMDSAFRDAVRYATLAEFANARGDGIF